MAYKMKGSTFYGSPLKQKKGEGKKPAEPKEELNQFGETSAEYKKRVADMGLNDDNKKPSPAKGFFGKLLNPMSMLPGKLGDMAGKLPGSNL
jgi:hypothetical protein